MLADELPLFPLHSVLLPGGRLGLRLFEPRYLDLVRRCGRSGSGFGICLILEGEEAGAPAIPAAYGTEAMIVDFAMTAEGLLGITVEGRRRFHIERSRAQVDGLLVARVRWLDDAPGERVRPEHGLLATLLERILDHAEKRGECPTGIDIDRQPQLLQAEWVGWRLAEWLPLSPTERQALLQESDPHRRLQRLTERLPDFQAE